MEKNWDDHRIYVGGLLDWATRLYKTAETEEEIEEAKRVLNAIMDGEINNEKI